MRTSEWNDRPARYQALSGTGTGTAGGITAPGLLRRAWARLFKRPEATMFHRCLAVHMHFAAASSALA
jgi:hypothetical protein